MKTSVLVLSVLALVSCKISSKVPSKEELKNERITEEAKVEGPSKDAVVVPEEKKSNLPAAPAEPAKPVVAAPAPPTQPAGSTISDANLLKADDNIKKLNAVLLKYPAASTLQTRLKRAEDLLAITLKTKSSEDMFRFCASVAPLSTGLTVDRILAANDNELARSYVAVIREGGGPCDMSVP